MGGMPRIKDKRLIFLGLVLMLLGFIYVYKRITPVLYYTINGFEEVKEGGEEAKIEEQPLNIYVSNDKSIGFSFRMDAQEDSIKSVKLKSSRNFTTQYPFIDYGSNLTLLLEIKEIKEKPVDETVVEDPPELKIPRKMYEITGGITNLKEREYKIRVEDNFGNLIDEKTFKIEGEKVSIIDLGTLPVEEEIKPSETSPNQMVKKVDPMVACLTVDDCVAVDCGCSCSGCGGFSYDTVVNKKYEGVWYYERSCEKPELCPQVCCKPAEIVCENNMCGVREL